MSKKGDSHKNAQFRIRAFPKSEQKVNKSAWEHLKINNSTYKYLTNTKIIALLTIKGKQAFAVFICEIVFLMIKGKHFFAIYFPNVDILLIKGNHVFVIFQVLASSLGFMC